MQYPICRQRGATLIVGLILLLLMTIIGMAAINISVTETKIMANAKDKQISFMGAEAALATAEDFLDDPDDPPTCSNPVGYLSEPQEGDNWWLSFNWGENAGTLAMTGSGANDAGYIIEPPYAGASPYLFESLSHTNGTRYNYYRVTSRAEGPGRSETYLQSVFLLRERMGSGC